MSVFCHAIEDEAELSTEENSRRSSFVAPPSTRLQLTFDFHRLNILLLRAVVQDSVVVGRKVATVTLSHAKINAGVGEFSKYLQNVCLSVVLRDQYSGITSQKLRGLLFHFEAYVVSYTGNVKTCLSILAAHPTFLATFKL